MQYSIVNLSEVRENSDFRIDAEYWKPEYYDLVKLLNYKKSKDFFYYTEFIKKGIFDISPKEYTNHNGIPFVRSGDIKNIFLSYNNMVQINQIVHKKEIKTELNKNDLVLSKVGTIGNFGINFEKDKINFSQNVIGIKIKQEYKNISGFLLSYCNSKYGQNQIKKNVTGQVQEKLTLNDIKFLKIIDLSRLFQESIASLVNKSYTLRESADTLYKEAEDILLEELGFKDYQIKNQKYFVKNLSDTQKVSRIDAEYFQPKYENLINKIKEYKGGYNILDNICKIKKCIEPGSSEYKENGIPFIRVSNLGIFDINSNNQQYVSELFYNKNIEHQPNKNEILLSKDGTLGTAYCLYKEPDKMICSGGIVRLINTKIQPLCLTLFLNSIISKMQIDQKSGGALISHWLIDDIKNLLIPILPDSIQSTISSKLHKSFLDRQKSLDLLAVAKGAVEVAIEDGEDVAFGYIDNNL